MFTKRIFCATTECTYANEMGVAARPIINMQIIFTLYFMLSFFQIVFSQFLFITLSISLLCLLFFFFLPLMAFFLSNHFFTKCHFFVCYQFIYLLFRFTLLIFFFLMLITEMAYNQLIAYFKNFKFKNEYVYRKIYFILFYLLLSFSVQIICYFQNLV